jgi:beta-galactosidase
MLFMATQAAFYPNRIYKIRTKTSLNAGWKFYLNDPADTSSVYKTSYSDASWATVNIPHSTTYVPPDEVAEKCTTPAETTGVSGNCWYRNTFTVPSTGPTQKYFLEFDGAMQTAQVWLNGTPVGTHNAGGFTGFSFDVTGLINRTGSNLLAVRLDYHYRWDVPPGNVPSTIPGGGAEGEYPDFLLFGGLCRDVWLVATGNVYIPLNGQQVSTPLATSTLGAVRLRTAVRNDGTAATTCTVQFVVANAANTIVGQKSLTQTVGAGTSVLFDQTDSIVNPALWSPASPNLYEVFTKVFVDTQAVDDNVERFGIRSIAWSSTSGFYLNGAQYLEKGVCMHQEFAWVGQALPDSRYAQEVLLARNAGFNAIRCSHYPRPPAFYDACDELGMLCEPEVPFWGGSMTYYPPAFWTNLDSAAAEMVRGGRNHPSIIQWGIANEPNSGFDAQFTQECAVIKSFDSTRFTAIINNKSATENLVPDILGYNYGTTYSPINKGLYTSEYHQGWLYSCRRGDTVSRSGHGAVPLPPAGFFVHTDTNCYGGSGCTLQSEDTFTLAYSSTASGTGWLSILNATGANKPLAGGHLWVLVDYNSDCNVGTHPMGILDQYRIPKKAYYTFQTNWTSTAADYPVRGATPASLKIEADVTSLVADSTDLSRIIVSARNSSGQCAWSYAPVTLQVTGPATVFDTVAPRKLKAGKIGYILKSTNTPGTITVIASSPGLTPDTLTLTSSAPDFSPLPFIWPATRTLLFTGPATAGNITVRQMSRGIFVTFPTAIAEKCAISLVTLQGKVFSCPMAKSAFCIEIPTGEIPAGFYLLKVKMQDQTVLKRVVLAK